MLFLDKKAESLLLTADEGAGKARQAAKSKRHVHTASLRRINLLTLLFIHSKSRTNPRNRKKEIDKIPLMIGKTRSIFRLRFKKSPAKAIHGRYPYIYMTQPGLSVKHHIKVKLDSTNE
jgi:hypothetical protein